MDIQFEILMDQEVGEKRKFNIQVKKYVENKSELFSIEEQDIPIVVENLPLRLQFKSKNQTDKLYFDIFDSLPNNAVVIDSSGLPYVSPRNNEYTLYDNNNEYLALIPGYYTLCVVYNGIHYYSLVKVTSKQINEEQWLSMRDEIETVISGLAQETLQKRLGNKGDKNGSIVSSIYNKLSIVKKQYPTFINTLNYIEANPKYKIQKEYISMNRNKINQLDPITIKNLKMSNKEKIQAGKNKISYFVPENVELKHYLLKLVKAAKRYKEEVYKILSNIREEIKNLEKYSFNKNTLAAERLKKSQEEFLMIIKILSNIKNSCLNLLEKDFMNTLPNNIVSRSSMNFSKNIHYRKVKDFYKIFEDQKLTINLSTDYQYCWKRTDKLYELWGVIQFTKLLLKLGYVLDESEGTLFEVSEGILKGKAVPYFENAKISFKKENLKIDLVYDMPLPLYKSVSLEECPLKAETTHNRPDIRIDVYDQTNYIGTILGDFKYRPLRNIWTNSNRISQNDSSSKRQFFEYKNSIVSDYFLKDSPLKNRINAVREVWAIYPKNKKNANISSNVERIKLIELTPLGDNKEFFDLLENSLRDLIQEAELIKKLVSVEG